MTTVAMAIRANKYILAVIVLFAAVFRLWNLGSIPPGLTPDEAALGYNAYSILQTGNDEYGEVLPLIFKSFGDYKPGFYVYTAIPFVAILGLSEFSVRLPSVVAGLFTVISIYLILKILFKNEQIGLAGAFAAAVNPWLIYFSRGAWEANLSLAFTLLGILFFLKSLEKEKSLLISAAFFGLTLITYQGAKISTLIVVLILAVLYKSEILKFRKVNIFLSLLIGIVFLIPVIFTFLNGQTFRLNIYSIFSYRRPDTEIQNIKNQELSNTELNFLVFHTEKVNYVRAILGRYFNNFSGRFLFFDGDWANPVSTPPYQGVLLLSDLILLPIGFYFLLKSKENKSKNFIFLWLLMAPISVALSRDELNAVRDLNLAVPLVVVSSFGVYGLLSNKIKKVNLFGAVLCVLSIGSAFLYFADAYYIHTPAHNSQYFRYGYKQVFEFVEPIREKYSKVVFEQSFNQPYIYYLFYGSKDPGIYQTQEKLSDSEFKGDVGYITSLDNISFERLDWQVIKNSHNVLVVAAHTSVPPEVFAYKDKYVLLNQIKYLNGRDVAFDIFEIK